jgi:hypothetical protein
MRACAVLDMYSAFETAREAFDKADFEREQKEIENEAKRSPRKR